jgi:ribonuclease P protein component
VEKPTVQTLPKQERLRGGGAISRLFEGGSRGSSKTVTALALPGGAGGSPAARVAFIAGKKLGCAVLRARMRRRLRAAYRVQKDEIALPAGLELALMAKKGVLEARWPDLMNDVKLAARRAVGGDASCGRPPRGPSR